MREIRNGATFGIERREQREKRMNALFIAIKKRFKNYATLKYESNEKREERKNNELTKFVHSR